MNGHSPKTKIWARCLLALTLLLAQGWVLAHEISHTHPEISDNGLCSVCSSGQQLQTVIHVDTVQIDEHQAAPVHEASHYRCADSAGQPSYLSRAPPTL